MACGDRVVFEGNLGPFSQYCWPTLGQFASLRLTCHGSRHPSPRIRAWARDVRGEQRDLLLMTAYLAKGHEFDHVAILNGGRDRSSRGEDADAPRRLFYVAMTRARSTLTVQTDGPHAFAQPGDAVLSRHVTPGVDALPRALATPSI